MYRLTLTQSERQAMDWVDRRYSNGDELFTLLWCESELDCEEFDWDSEHDLTFIVPEHVAWQIRENAEQEDGFWPCFAPEFADKMQAFVDSIV